MSATRAKLVEQVRGALDRAAGRGPADHTKCSFCGARLPLDIGHIEFVVRSSWYRPNGQGGPTVIVRGAWRSCWWCEPAVRARRWDVLLEDVDDVAMVLELRALLRAFGRSATSGVREVAR